MKRSLVIASFIIFNICSYAQVGINNVNPDSSAVLDLKSDDKGLLVPRLDISNIANPAKGLMVYDTTQNSFCFYDGVSWYYMVPWKKMYDPGDPTAPQIVFTDGVNLGNVGVGTDAPASKFTVLGNLSVGANNVAPTDGAQFAGNVRIATTTGVKTLEVGGEINASGNINTVGKIQEGGNDLLPAGSIIMWSGTSVPDGWKICDGTQGTPDLRGKFIVGVSGAGDYATVGNTGGTESVILNIDQMPKHNHTSGNLNYVDRYTGYVALSLCTNDCEHNPNEYGVYGREETFGVTGSTGESGNDQAHENRPPYYVMAFIMKK